jgi:hypothetical protein
MNHFPFIDNSGTVNDVLKEPQDSLDMLLQMGLPARKRLVTKVYDEMRFGNKAGIRLYDIPEALNVYYCYYYNYYYYYYYYFA